MRFYVERYAHGWSIWDRETDTNDGGIYPTKAEAEKQAALYDIRPALFIEVKNSD